MTQYALFLDTTAGPSRIPLAILLPAALGLLGIYAALPRPQGALPRIGGITAGFAVLAGGILWVWAGMALVETLLFYAFSAIAVVAGGLLVTQRNPVHAALSFAMVVLSTCGLFLLQAAPFLMAATIIIYAGAIIVTFLFVIMLAQQTGSSDADQRSREPFLACFAGFMLLGSLLYLLHRTYDTSEFQRLLDSTTRAAEATTHEDMERVVGQGNDFFNNFRTEAEHMRVPADLSKPLLETLTETQSEWNKRNVDMTAMRKLLVTLNTQSVQVRDSNGSLQPRRDLRISTYSRVRREQGETAQEKSTMPAENVAYLGRSLFTDYLLPVELGGTLLLVATIGAIAIAGRRSEGTLR